MRLLRIVCSLVLGIATVVSSGAQTTSASAGPSEEERALKSFAAMHPVDAHVHVFKTDAAFQALLERLNLEDPNKLFARPTRSELARVDDDLGDREYVPGRGQLLDVPRSAARGRRAVAAARAQRARARPDDPR